MKQKITVILTKQVRGLGDAYDTVHVTRGYFRNQLLPNKLAVLATPDALKRVETLHVAHEAEHKARVAAHEAATAKLRDTTLMFSRKGEGETLYGSVSAHDVETALAERGMADAVVKTEPLKSFGKHEVVVDFGDGVKGTVMVNVKEER